VEIGKLFHLKVIKRKKEKPFFEPNCLEMIERLKIVAWRSAISVVVDTMTRKKKKILLVLYVGRAKRSDKEHTNFFLVELLTFFIYLSLNILSGRMKEIFK
jgi:hypothetical protein